MRNYFLLFSLALSVSAQADWKQQRFDLLQQAKNPANAIRLETKLYVQKIDHFTASDDRTFKQRYYVDSSLADGTFSPVLFYLCGEAACKDTSLNGAIRNHAKTLKAHLVALEHRYYGESQPFDKLSTENLKYLSIKQALTDAATFQETLQKDLGLTGKWIAVGGSYPGSLAAYYRQKYPNLVVGALSSSGPVLAKEDFEEYDHHVWKVAGAACAKQIKSVVTLIEAALTTEDQAKAIKEKFAATALVENDDFLYLIADMGALAVQYGYRDEFCKLLNQPNPIEGYATFTKKIFKEWKMDATSGSVQGSYSEDPKDYPEIGMRQWMYQSCTEYGYWQIAYRDENESVRSRRINLDYHHVACKRLFGIETPAQTKETNEEYYKPLFAPATTNILFTNGSQDPWSNLSVLTISETSPGLKSFTIEGAAHCDDLRLPKITDSVELKKARSLFAELAQGWLKL